MWTRLYQHFSPKAAVETTPEDYKNAMRLVAKTLGGDYMVHGSGACLLHGVTFTKETFPSDIDITVTNPVKAITALETAAGKGEFKLERVHDSNPAVHHFMITLKNGTKVELDLTSADDFGLKNTTRTLKEGVQVTSIPETLLSLHLREQYKGPREKDRAAFNFLVEKYKEYWLHTEEGANELIEFQELTKKTRNTELNTRVNTLLSSSAPEDSKRAERKATAGNIPANFLDPSYRSSPGDTPARENDPSGGTPRLSGKR
jgi:hypothetical protein